MLGVEAKHKGQNHNEKNSGTLDQPQAYIQSAQEENQTFYYIQRKRKKNKVEILVYIVFLRFNHILNI